ncbi:MAG: DUF3459 domain-containing protein, partial [Anaerolineales bacterium]|nr:DUF3459 domain-containing protein [Anaerolineales bacterium]
DECHLPFNFHLIYGVPSWEAVEVRKLVEAYEAALPDKAWPNWVLGNHDQHRIATRVGAAQARVANMLLLTLRGTPTSYYGEEIGMEDVPIPPEYVQDPPAVNQPEIAHIIGRDPERTPMQWDDAVNAGFAGETAVPWLPVAPDYQQRNVALQNQEATSMLALYRALAALRCAEPALHMGDYRSIDVANDDVFAYLRSAPNADTFLILLNFTNQTQIVRAEQIANAAAVAVATDMQRTGTIALDRVVLTANEGMVLRL